MGMARAGTVEGFFALDHLPGPVEASFIRAALGVDHRLARPPQPLSMKGQSDD
jgi:hypothetical protein